MGLLEGVERMKAGGGGSGGGGGGGLFGGVAGPVLGNLPVVGGVASSALDFNRLGHAEDLYGGVDPNGDMQRSAYGAERFGMQGRQGYGQMTGELAQNRAYLNNVARGGESLSAEQLRQALPQIQAQQMSMAAGASPANAAMAARNASSAAAAGAGGLAGSAALAGIAERQAANQALTGLNLGQRQQDLNATLGGQQNAITGYNNIEQGRAGRYAAAAGAPTPGEQILGGAGAVGSLLTLSDRRTKTGIRKADADAEALMKTLRPRRWRYKDAANGEGEFVGVMTQDLKKSRAGRGAVIDTPRGEVVDGGRLVTALAATLPGLHKRLRKLERK